MTFWKSFPFLGPGLGVPYHQYHAGAIENATGVTTAEAMMIEFPRYRIGALPQLPSLSGLAPLSADDKGTRTSSMQQRAGYLERGVLMIRDSLASRTDTHLPSQRPGSQRYMAISQALGVSLKRVRTRCASILVRMERRSKYHMCAKWKRLTHVMGGGSD